MTINRFVNGTPISETEFLQLKITNPTLEKLLSLAKERIRKERDNFTY